MATAARSWRIFFSIVMASARAAHGRHLRHRCLCPRLGTGKIALTVMPIFRRAFRKYDRLNDSVEENCGIRVVKSCPERHHEKESSTRRPAARSTTTLVHVERTEVPTAPSTSPTT